MYLSDRVVFTSWSECELYNTKDFFSHEAAHIFVQSGSIISSLHLKYPRKEIHV